MRSETVNALVAIAGGLVMAVLTQIALNVALFVPMGVLLRARYQRGVAWAFGLGLPVRC